MLTYFLFIIYLLLLGWWISRMKFVNSTGIARKYILAFFVLKIAVGCFYGYWYSLSTSAIQPDTWRFHEQALKEYHLLFSNPHTYFSNIFYNEYDAGWWRFFTPANSYWNDLRDNLMVKFISILNILSFGNYYVNVVLFSFISFFSFIFLYKTFVFLFGKLNTYATLFIFLTPSCLFWTSGLHKDALILLFLSILFYKLARIVLLNEHKVRHYLIIVLMLLLIFPFRNYISLGLLPGILALLIVARTNWNNWLVFGTMFIIGAFVFFGGKFISPKLNFPQKIAYRQAEFQMLQGNSRLPQQTLEPSFTSFASHAPEAFNHALLRPYPWQSKGLLEWAAAAELVILVLVFILMLLYPAGKKIFSSPFVIFILSFLLVMLLLIGYTVPFAGAIVRYRAIYIMLLFVLFAGNIDLKLGAKSN